MEIETRVRFLVCLVTGVLCEPLLYIFCGLAFGPRIVLTAKNDSLING
jgi:hypothetical protein